MMQTSEPDGELERTQVLFLPLKGLFPWPASGLACPAEGAALQTWLPATLLQSPR